MNEAEMKQRLDQVTNIVILGITRVNYLEQLFTLIAEKNHVVMVQQGFYSMVIRDANSSLLLSIRKIVESRGDTHNAVTLIDALREWVKANRPELFDEINAILIEIDDARQAPVAREGLVAATTQAAHQSLKLPTAPTNVSYGDIKDWMTFIGEKLNQVSGLLWNSSTVLEIYDSSGDSFTKELRYIERAEIAGTYLIRRNESHEAVKFADERLKAKQDNKPK